MRTSARKIAGHLGAVALAAATAACVDEYANAPSTAYAYTGLAQGPGYGWFDDGYSQYYGGKFDIYVGIPFEAKLTAQCYDSAGTKADWWAEASIFSGDLPPGLEISYDKGSIVGVPTRAGTWHLRIAFTDLTCAELSYETRYQDLTIKTSGN